MNRLPKRLIIYITVCSALLFAGCTEKKVEEDANNRVSIARSYLEEGSRNDKAWQMRLAEHYYRMSYETLKDDPKQDWKTYGDAGFRYAYLLYDRGDMEGSLAVVGEMLAMAEKNDDFPQDWLSALLGQMALCQLELEQPEAAKQTYGKAFEARLKAVGGERQGNFDMVIMCNCVFLSFFETGYYDESAKWLKQCEDELDAYERSGHNDTVLLEEYKGHHALHRARLLQATGHSREAAAVFDAIPSHRIFNPLGIDYAAKYLMASGRYGEAADMYARIDTTFHSVMTRNGEGNGVKVTFDIIRERLAPRYNANRLAGRNTEALAVADVISDAIDTALLWQKKSNAAELAVIYQTHEKELALKEAQSEARTHRILLFATLLVILLVIWLLHRSRLYNRELMEKNRSLYLQIRQREQAETQKREQLETQPVETLTKEQQLYNRLCVLMKDPDVYTDSSTNHETLARLLGTNRTYLREALHECAGMTPTDFINMHRIRHAAHLLITTNEPVGFIIEQSGITNRSTFNRLFREHYSMSPTEYRSTSKSLR